MSGLKNPKPQSSCPQISSHHHALSPITIGLVTIGACAKPMVRAAAGLEVSLSTPADRVTSISELRVVATVENVGDEDLKVAKLGTVLDKEYQTRSFIVTDDGKQALK